eukprot:1151181-Pelagomonas_calceolata.AAC.10
MALVAGYQASLKGNNLTDTSISNAGQTATPSSISLGRIEKMQDRIGLVWSQTPSLLLLSCPRKQADLMSGIISCSNSTSAEMQPVSGQAPPSSAGQPSWPF